VLSWGCDAGNGCPKWQRDECVEGAHGLEREHHLLLPHVGDKLEQHSNGEHPQLHDNFGSNANAIYNANPVGLEYAEALGYTNAIEQPIASSVAKRDANTGAVRFTVSEP
jgi:hypothetical protein